MAINDVYRTNDGQAYFEFNFVKVGQFYEIDIIRTPNYNGRSEGLHETHRLPSDRGGYKVCFAAESAVTSLERARKWVEAWSEGTWRYIKTGATF